MRLCFRRRELSLCLRKKRNFIASINLIRTLKKQTNKQKQQQQTNKNTNTTTKRIALQSVNFPCVKTIAGSGKK